MRTWEGQDGQTRARNEIVADRVKFLDRQSTTPLPDKSEDSSVTPPTDKSEDSDVSEFAPEDIPF